MRPIIECGGKIPQKGGGDVWKYICLNYKTGERKWWCVMYGGVWCSEQRQQQR